MNADDLREINAKIAVAFFGWRWMKHTKRGRASLIPPEDGMWIRWNFAPEAWEPCDSTAQRFGDWDKSGGLAEDANKHPWGPMAMNLPKFSSDPIAMMMLWNKLRTIAICTDVSADDDGFRFDISFGHQKHVYEFADTLPLAMCEAAMEMAEMGWEK